jgi:hypothetical protein
LSKHFYQEPKTLSNLRYHFYINVVVTDSAPYQLGISTIAVRMLVVYMNAVDNAVADVDMFCCGNPIRIHG